MTMTNDTEYQARARATLGAELGALADQLTAGQLEALATEVVVEVLANDRGFGEYVTEYVRNITSSSLSDADRLRKVRSYADLISGVQPVTPDPDLEVCVDCAHLLANAETPEDNPDFDLVPEWDGYVLALACGDECEGFFSWSTCDGCGSTLGGDRHPAAIIEAPPTNLEEFTEAFPGVPEAVLFTLVEGHPDYSPEDFTYEGEFYSYADLANHMVEEGLFGEIPEHLARYIDIDAIGRDLDCEGVYEIRHNFTGYYWTIN